MQAGKITWESRTLPDSMKKGLTPYGVVFFSFHLQRSYSLVVFNQCATLYLVRIFSAARCAGFRQKKSPGRVGRCRIPQRKASDDVWGFSLLYRKLQKKSGCDKIGNET